MYKELLEENKKFQIIYDRLSKIVQYCENYISVEQLTALMSKHHDLKYTNYATIRKDCRGLLEYGFVGYELRPSKTTGTTRFYKKTVDKLTEEHYVIKYDIIGKLERQKAQQLIAVENFKKAKDKKLEGLIEGSRYYDFDVLADKLIESSQLKRREMKKQHVGQFMGESSLAKF